MMSVRSVNVVLVVVLLLMVAGGGAAQTVPQEPDSTATESGDDAGNDGGGGLIDVPSFDPVENLKELLEALQEAPGWIVDTMNEMVYGIPAPGDPEEPKTWMSPENGLWPGMMDYTAWTTAIATAILLVSGALSFFHERTYMRKEAWKRWLIALIMILGTWTLLPFALHLADAIVGVLVPDSSEVFAEWANFAKVGSGLVVLLIVGILKASVLGIGLFVLILERFLIYLGFGLWPIAWALRSTRFGLARSLGETLVFLFGVVIATKIGQALIARLLFTLDWQGISPSSVVYVLSLGAGVFVMLIYFPWKMLEHANDAASVSLGMSAGARAAGRAGESAKARANERVGQVGDRYRNWRTTSTSTETSTAGNSGGSGSSSQSRDRSTDGYENRSSPGGSNRTTIFGSGSHQRRREARERRRRYKEHVRNNDGE